MGKSVGILTAGGDSPGLHTAIRGIGTAAADFLAADMSGVMVAVRNDAVTAVPLKDVAGKRKVVPLDHPWIKTALSLGVGFGE